MNEDICKVTLDGNEYESNDFVAVLAYETGDASMFYCTDALTLGMAMKMIAKAFITEMNNLSEEDRNNISDILGDAFIKERVGEDLIESDANLAARMSSDE